MLYILDLIIIFTFNSRLYLEDIGKFIGDVDLKILDWKIYLLFSIFIISSFIFVVKSNLPSPNIKIKIIAIMSLLILACSYNVDSSVRSPFFKNYIFVNFQSTYKKEYSPEFISSFESEDNEQCVTVKSIKPKNIVIFMFESWSYYHSYWFGDDSNWTPELDKLAKNNVAFKQFYANGFTTEAGLYALFTGRPVIPYKVKYGTDGALGLNKIYFDTSFPEELSKLGYYTTFITSGDLGFLQKRKWLESLKFNNIIGNGAFSPKDRKFLFYSVSDEKLYSKVYDIVSNSENNFVVVENVNTHQPYYYPDGKDIKQSEEFAFRYADKQLSEVIKKLIDEDTMIVVMSDHRAMTSMTRKEQSTSGRMSVSRVPMFMIWNNKQRIVDSVFQQTDILPGIVNTVKGYQCHSGSRGAILPLDNMVGTKCVYHARGDERSKVSVMCDGQQFDVLLDGDDTGILDEYKHIDESVNYINSVRINSDKRN
ncbi:LTA synthase family protein [Vibrio albus]|nr:sulfatase-like hydrolase/transferase [Vibrio albus]